MRKIFILLVVLTVSAGLLPTGSGAVPMILEGRISDDSIVEHLESKGYQTFVEDQQLVCIGPPRLIEGADGLPGSVFDVSYVPLPCNAQSPMEVRKNTLWGMDGTTEWGYLIAIDRESGLRDYILYTSADARCISAPPVDTPAAAPSATNGQLVANPSDLIQSSETPAPAVNNVVREKEELFFTQPVNEKQFRSRLDELGLTFFGQESDVCIFAGYPKPAEGIQVLIKKADRACNFGLKEGTTTTNKAQSTAAKFHKIAKKGGAAVGVSLFVRNGTTSIYWKADDGTNFMAGNPLPTAAIVSDGSAEVTEEELIEIDVQNPASAEKAPEPEEEPKKVTRPKPIEEPAEEEKDEVAGVEEESPEDVSDNSSESDLTEYGYVQQNISPVDRTRQAFLALAMASSEASEILRRQGDLLVYITPFPDEPMVTTAVFATEENGAVAWINYPEGLSVPEHPDYRFSRIEIETANKAATLKRLESALREAASKKAVRIAFDTESIQKDLSGGKSNVQKATRKGRLTGLTSRTLKVQDGREKEDVPTWVSVDICSVHGMSAEGEKGGEYESAFRQLASYYRCSNKL